MSNLASHKLKSEIKYVLQLMNFQPKSIKVRMSHRTDEKLCLQWNDFRENISSAFGELRQDRDFTDVTLACEDGQQVEVHKMVLIASSPFFLALLKRNRHTHPLVYMKGVKFEDLVAMVDFFYHGEANVFQENLESFLALAEELQLKGLMGNQTEDIPKMTEKAKVAKTLKNGRKDITSSEKVASILQTTKKNSFETTVAVADQAIDLEKLDEEVKSMMAFTQNDAPGKAKG